MVFSKLEQQNENKQPESPWELRTLTPGERSPPSSPHSVWSWYRPQEANSHVPHDAEKFILETTPLLPF